MNLENLRKEIRLAINRNSAENGSDTPDFILADYLMDCLEAYNKAVTTRNQLSPVSRTTEEGLRSNL